MQYTVYFPVSESTTIEQLKVIAKLNGITANQAMRNALRFYVAHPQQVEEAVAVERLEKVRAGHDK